MNVHRLHVRPHGGTADMPSTFDFCLRKGVLGVGWRISSNKSTKDWDEYYSQAILEHPGGVGICSSIQRNVAEGDLIWTRDPGSQYYLARVTSPWEYLADEEAIKRGIDVANVVRCDIRAVPLDSVPGKVVACFDLPGHS
ncbi:MAG: hypothetical protein LC667_10500 [Thioalkalivibrio sp.]|nr:hypothetical protein [Thioalkalivibrio sp.]